MCDRKNNTMCSWILLYDIKLYCENKTTEPLSDCNSRCVYDLRTIFLENDVLMIDGGNVEFRGMSQSLRQPKDITHSTQTM